MKKYSAVIVGCGPRGRDHAKAFLANSDRFELRAICDQDATRLKAAADELKSPLKQYAQAEEMLSKEKPDVFCFATLPAVRLPLVEMGIRHGVKAIAMEKPMANTMTEATTIYKACEAAGVKLTVCHQHKYGGHWKKVKEIVESGSIGKVHTIHATAKGWLLQYGTHLIDYMMFLNGKQRVKWVVGHISGNDKLTDTHPSPGYAMGQFEFANGVRGILECGNLVPDQPGENAFWRDAGATVYGTEGYARAIVGHGWQAFTRDSKGMIGSSEEAFRETENTFGYIHDLADWLDDPKKVHPCSAEVSYHGHQVAMAVSLSAIENRKVELPLVGNEQITERLAKVLSAS